MVQTPDASLVRPRSFKELEATQHVLSQHWLARESEISHLLHHHQISYQEIQCQHYVQLNLTSSLTQQDDSYMRISRARIFLLRPFIETKNHSSYLHNDNDPNHLNPRRLTRLLLKRPCLAPTSCASPDATMQYKAEAPASRRMLSTP